MTTDKDTDLELAIAVHPLVLIALGIVLAVVFWLL